MSEFVDTSILQDLDIDGAVAPSTLPGDQQYELQVTRTEINGEKSYIAVQLDAVGADPFTKSIRHMIFLPKADDDDKKRNNKLYGYKQFCQAFGIEGEDRKNPEIWIGKTGYAILGEEDNPPYGRQNTLKRLVGSDS